MNSAIFSSNCTNIAAILWEVVFKIKLVKLTYFKTASIVYWSLEIHFGYQLDMTKMTKKTREKLWYNKKHLDRYLPSQSDITDWKLLQLPNEFLSYVTIFRNVALIAFADWIFNDAQSIQEVISHCMFSANDNLMDK